MNKKEQIKEQDIIYCPRCKTGNLSEKSYPDGNSYWKCSNYPYCDYTIRDKEALRKNIYVQYVVTIWFIVTLIIINSMVVIIIHTVNIQRE